MRLVDPEDKSTTARPTSYRRAAPITALMVGAGLIFAFGINDYITLEALKENRVALQQWVTAHGVAAWLVYTAVYALAISISIPGGLILTLAGGFLFGPYLATVCVVVGATIGSTIVFLAARYAFADFLQVMFGATLDKMEAGFNERPKSYLLVLRLVPIFPFWLINIVPAFLGVSLSNYVIATFFGIIPATFIYTLVGDGAGAVLDRGQDLEFRIIYEPRFIFPIVGLAVLALVPVVYKKFKSTRTMTG